MLILLTDFSNKTRTCSYEEIIEEAEQLPSAEEGEPELMMRALLTALLSGKREDIEPLILNPTNATILWQGAYPSDVASLLDLVSSSHSIARVYGTEEEGEVRLFTADYPFPITVKKVDGEWKVDATDIIKIRKDIFEQAAQNDNSSKAK